MVTSFRRNISPRAIVIAAVVAGTVYLLTGLVAMAAIYQFPPLMWLRYFASLVMGPQVLTSSDAAPLAVGLLVHYGVSLVAATLIAVCVHRWGLLVGILLGALLGLAIYSINLYSLTRFFPWYFAINGPVLLAVHVLFGAVAGGVYESFDHFDVPLVKETPNV